MPSTVVHVAFAGLLGVALLGDEFDTRAIVLVMGCAAVIDLDTLIGIVVPGTHRAALHNVWIVLVPAAALLWDGTIRAESTLRDRWGSYGHRVAWASLAGVFVAHVLFDAFFNGVNLFWPLHDRFYDLSGELLVTDQRGLVQTFVELDAGSLAESTARGTTENTHYRTGFDPTRDEPATAVERIFPIAATGERFVLTVAGLGTVLVRLVEGRRAD
ncbi:metal-dependent hydrolase [Natrinema pallidum]|uniref:Membrane-bound metal-dependent hydrolase n=2 Tax=Natrinema pallidum TaxID=69527 RepID=L9YIT3_9EURY|nr:metal-dependent hydrolase [Natrinema pallidum]ELY74014.1 membrane-bound metal-dependent hydrolase [Natrinema pallidum DSM 3751]QCW02206.1 metal-dependent hydrolase [Natrinema pallidum]